MHSLTHAARKVAAVVSSKKSTRLLSIGVGLFVVLGLTLLLTQPAAAASLTDTVARVLSVALNFIASMLGKLTVVLFGLVVQVAQYNDFGSAAAVATGWVVVRDVSNMFFIMILLVIAFGAVFRLEQYRYTTMLRRLIVMAVLINFSKLITGFFIDLMQVIMLTFVNAFANTAAGNLANALGLQAILQLDPSIAGSEVSPTSVTVTLLLGVIMLTVAMVVTLTYVLMLVIRVIALWVLTVLSPLAYLFNAFPSTKTYSAQWWDYFWKYATMGPFLAFFLWLTLTITRAGNAASLINVNVNSDTNVIGSTGGGVLAAALSKISTAEGILSFIIATVLLVIGMSFSSRVGGIAGNLAGNTVRRVQRSGAGAARLAFVGGAAGAALGAKGIGGLFNRAGGTASAENAAMRATGWMGRSRIPVLNDWAARQNSRMAGRQRKRNQEQEEFIGNIRDVGILRRYATTQSRTPEGQARRRAARVRVPSQLPDQDRRQVIRDMSDQQFAQLSPGELFRLADGGFDFIHEAPDKAEQIVRRLPMVKRAAAGLQNHRWDNESQQVVLRRDEHGNEVPAGVPQAPPNYDAHQYRSSVDLAKLNATQRAVQDRFGGSAEQFYSSAEYKVNPKLYLPQEDFLTASEQQQRLSRAAERTGFNVNTMSGAEKAVRQFDRNGTGQLVTLALNHADAALKGLNLDPTKEGVNLTGPKREKASTLLAAKYRADAQEQRREDVFQQLRSEEESSGQEITENTERRLRAQAETAVRNDGAFQQQVEQQAQRFGEALRSASSIAIINKSRVTGGAKEVLRHEKAHDVVNTLSPQERQRLVRQFHTDSLNEKRKYIREHWDGGQQMAERDVDTEVLTEIIANQGREGVKGPLTITEQDAEYNPLVFKEFSDRLKKFRDESARMQVNQLTDAQINTLWGELTPERQREITEQLRPDLMGKNIDAPGFAGDVRQRLRFGGKKVPREFFTEAYANFRDQQQGVDAEGRRVGFQGEEQDLALLIRSMVQKETPKYRRGAPGGAAPEMPPSGPPSAPGPRPGGRPGPTGAPFAPTPSGVRATTVQPPEPQQRFGVEEAASPVINQSVVKNITNNTTVRSIANDLARQVASEVNRLPVSTNLQYALNRLRDEIRGVADRQGIARANIRGLEAEIGDLEKRVINSSRAGEEDPALQKDLKSFLDGFESSGGEGGSTPPRSTLSDRDQSEPPAAPLPNPPGVEESI